MADPTRPYRIAVREEGKVVNAYWTRTETMEGSELIASINRDLLAGAPELWEAFKALMACCSAELAKQRLGARATSVEISDAPEHERAGRA